MNSRVGLNSVPMNVLRRQASAFGQKSQDFNPLPHQGPGLTGQRARAWATVWPCRRRGPRLQRRCHDAHTFQKRASCGFCVLPGCTALAVNGRETQ